MTRYPEDEFDVAARERAHKGVHRPAEPRWKRFLPILIAAIAGPLLAWGLVSALSSDNKPLEQPKSGQTSQAAPQPSASTSPSPSPTTQPAAPVVLTTPVKVLNGTSTTGLAGRTAKRLTDAGFTKASTGDHRANDPAATTVFYSNPQLKTTAVKVGETLGITNVVERASATEAITVILRSDFKE